MQIFTESVKCSICGGDGIAMSKDAANLWFGGQLVHSNPQICIDTLKLKTSK